MQFPGKEPSKTATNSREFHGDPAGRATRYASHNRADVIDELMPLVRRCLLTSRGLRRCGSAAYDLCNVARGHLTAFLKQASNLGIRQLELF